MESLLYTCFAAAIGRLSYLLRGDLVKDASKERVEKETRDWEYLRELPEVMHGFRLEHLMEIDGDVYDLYRYVNEQAHRQVTVYFHEETKEYKVRVKIGLIEFCRMEYITGSFEAFDRLLREQFDEMMADLAEFHPEHIGSIAREKHFMEWEYGKSLPTELEGFQLFIHPDEPVEITNGSYILIDYCDFSIESNFIIYYNMFRDEFCGEARIHNIPDVSYDFDSSELDELEEKLEQLLVPRLQGIRKRAEAAQ